MAKVVIVKSATNGSERRDGQQAVMAKRVARAPTLQASLDLQAMITDVTSRNRHVSAIALLQGEGSEDTVNRESVIANMKVSDADVVKAVNSVFFLERRCCRTRTELISSDRVQSGRGFPGEDDEQEDPVMQGLRDDVARGLDDGWSQGSRTVTVDTALVCSMPE